MVSRRQAINVAGVCMLSCLPEPIATRVIPNSLEIDVGGMRNIAEQGAENIYAIVGAGERNVKRFIETSRAQNC